MVLQASDELRHEWDGDYHWRESLYFNFADPANEIGAWLYLWVVPNQPMKSGMLVSFYHGITDRLDANEVAMRSPGHLYRGDAGNWVYCFKQDVPELIEQNFDDVELCGLKMRRGAPLEQYDLSFSDGAGTSFHFDARFMTRPWDYADGVFETPAWVAKNRYHRSWWAQGELTIGGLGEFSIDTTGDSDHSWGKRDRHVFAQNNFKMWSFQTRDGRMSVSAIDQGQPGNEVKMGFVDIDGDIQSVAGIETGSLYTEAGVQHTAWLRVRDAKDRVVEAEMDRMFSAIGNGAPTTTWGFEGVGMYEVKGYGACSGISSYFWPPVTTPALLHGQGK